MATTHASSLTISRLNPLSRSQRPPEPFYSMTESEALQMADAHYSGRHSPLTGFSSWGASFHQAMCCAYVHAEYEQRQDVHIAIMDIEQLDSGVLVWQAPHLIPSHGAWRNHEYLAYETIRGKGYKAVPVTRVLSGLKKISPRTFRMPQDENWFGVQTREKVFQGSPTDITTGGRDLFKAVRRVSEEFEHLKLPVAIALINVDPRRWMRAVEMDCGSLYVVSGRRNPTDKEMAVVMHELGNPDIPIDWMDMAWLRTESMVDTRRFPDVQQTIDFTRALLKYWGRKTAKINIGKSGEGVGRKMEAYLDNLLPFFEEIAAPNAKAKTTTRRVLKAERNDGVPETTDRQPRRALKAGRKVKEPERRDWEPRRGLKAGRKDKEPDRLERDATRKVPAALGTGKVLRSGRTYRYSDRYPAATSGTHKVLRSGRPY